MTSGIAKNGCHTPDSPRYSNHMLDQILIVIGITILIMISPGPDMVIVMRNTLIGGRRGGLLTSLGILTGNLVRIPYCALGIGLLISQSILLFSILKYAGAAYLIYLGVMSLKHAGDTIDPEAEAAKQRNKPMRRGWYWQGLINNILNPKGTLFYLGFFPTVITPETPSWGVAMLAALTVAISGLFWLLFVHGLDRQRVRDTIRKGQTVVNRVFGGLLILLGIRVAVLER